MMRTVLAALAGALLASGPLAAQVPQNLDFETAGRTTAAEGWSVYGKGYEITRDSLQPHSGRWSMRLSRAAATGDPAATASQMLPADRLAGRRLRVSGYIRTEAVDSAYSALWAVVMSSQGPLAVDTMPDRGPRGTMPWTRVEVELPVADSATVVYFGVTLAGPGRAWFDGIELAVLDSAGASPVPLAEALKAAPERPEKPEYVSWVRKHARPLASLTSDDFRDLRFLEKDLKGRRVVQLGESSHGVGQFDALKVRLIRYLHEKLGFDVVAFESSLFECTTAYELPDMDAKRLMRECIFGVWRAEETLPLFDYILQTRHTAHPLILTGFDDQSSSSGGRRRAAFMAGLIAPVDPAYAGRVRTTDSVWVARGMFQQDSARAHRAEMVAFYDTLAAFLDRHAPEISSRGRVPTVRVQLASRTARNMALFVQQNTSMGSIVVRDSAMAANLDFVLDSLFPGKKVITWGHNFHLMKGPSYQLPDSLDAMGERVARRRGGEVYTIGLFVYRGATALNNRQVVPVFHMPVGSLEHILAQVDSVPAVFLDLAHRRREPGNAWIFQPTRATDWGRTPIRIVPRDAYDALILVRDVTPPHYMW